MCVVDVFVYLFICFVCGFFLFCWLVVIFFVVCVVFVVCVKVNLKM